jgi:glycosyltransferase 2 family protein
VKQVKVWLGLAVSLALLWVAFRGVDPGELTRSLAQVRSVWLVPVVVTIFVRFWLTALRWQVLLRPVKLIGVHRLFGVALIGFMANNVLPARMGEFVRAYALAKSESLSKSLSFATIVLERVFDGFTLLAFLVAGVAFLRPEPWLVWSAVGSFCLYLGVLAGLIWLRGGRGVGRLLARLPGSVRERVAGLLDSFALGLDVLSDPRALAVTAALSLAIWLVNVAGLYAMFVAFSLDLPPYAAFLVLAIVAVALVLPSAPGYVGTFQVGTVAALALFAVPEATALSLSLLYHAVNYIPITAAGLVYLGSMNLTLGELRAAGEKSS